MGKSLLCLVAGIILGATLTSVATWSAPGDEFRGDLDIWADQQRRDQQLRDQDRRINDLDRRQRPPC